MKYTYRWLDPGPYCMSNDANCCEILKDDEIFVRLDNVIESRIKQIVDALNTAERLK